MGVQNRPRGRYWSALLLRIWAYTLSAVALWSLTSLALVFARRITYPMDLEWCEGGSLYMAWRLVHHVPVYVRPGDLFAPFPYPPGHTLAVAAAGVLFGGVDYLPGRLVSIVSFALLAGALFVSVRRQFDGRVHGAVAGLGALGVLASSFPATRGWYDLVRVDSMMIASVCLAAALVQRPRPGTLRIAGVAVAITVAVFTKQTAAFFAVWICAFAFFRNRREGIVLTAVALACCGLALGVLHLLTRGRYWFWMFGNLAEHPIDSTQLLTGFRPVVQFAPFIVLLPFAVVALLFMRRASADTALWSGMLVAGLPASLLPYAKHGGWLNDMIPAIVLLIPATTAVVADLLRVERRWTAAARSCVMASTALFIALHPIHVSAYVPDATLWAAANRFNARVAHQMPGGVLVPQLAFTPARNGQTNPHWHRMGHADLEWSRQAVDEDWSVVRAQARWALINSLDRGPFARAVRQHYRMVGNLPADERVHMITGGGVVDLDEVWERR